MSILTQFYGGGGGSSTGLQGIPYSYSGSLFAGTTGPQHVHGLNITPGVMIVHALNLRSPLFVTGTTYQAQIQWPGARQIDNLVGMNKSGYFVPHDFTFGATVLSMSISQTSTAQTGTGFLMLEY